VSVVVPTRDRPDDLRRCLESILRSTYPRDSLELLVIDNAPRTDSTLQVVETAFAGAPITYHREDAVGSSAARNAGLRLASGVFTLFADDDVVVDEDWLAHLVATLLADPEVICATGLVLPLELDTRAQLLFEQFGGFSKGVVPRVYDLEKNRPEHPLFPFNLGSFGSGNNAGFRTSALRKLGGFDTALGPGTSTRAGEDIEVFARCVFEGHALAYEPNAMVRHRHRRSDSELRQQLFNYGTGLSAALVKVLIRHPRQIPPFLFRLPYGLFFTLSRKSEKNSGMTAEYPRALRLAELRGMVRGPFAYLAERRRVARTRSSAAV
jgi:O-antigen biosynthesis protein